MSLTQILQATNFPVIFTIQKHIKNPVNKGGYGRDFYATRKKKPKLTSVNSC